MELSVYSIHLHMVGTAFESPRVVTVGPGRISKASPDPICGRRLFKVEMASRDPHLPRIPGRPSVARLDVSKQGFAGLTDERTGNFR